MDYFELKARIFSRRISASDGCHTARVWRIAENVRDNLPECSGERLLHILSRVQVLTQSLARDLRSGHTSPEGAAMVLDQLAQLANLNQEEWLQPDRR